MTGAAEVVVAVPAGTVLRGSQSLDASRNGDTLVLANGTFTALDPLGLAGLVVGGRATVVSEAGEPLDLDVAGTVHVACDAAIDASRLGYAGGTTAAPAGLAPDGVSTDRSPPLEAATAASAPWSKGADRPERRSMASLRRAWPEGAAPPA